VTFVSAPFLATWAAKLGTKARLQRISDGSDDAAVSSDTHLFEVSSLPGVAVRVGS
jgi:hypothetical protein